MSENQRSGRSLLNVFFCARPDDWVSAGLEEVLASCLELGSRCFYLGFQTKHWLLVT